MKGKVLRFLIGCALGGMLWFIASIISGVQTVDARDFLGGYRDWDALTWAFAAPVASVLLTGLLLASILNESAVNFLRMHGSQHTIAALIALGSLIISVVVGEIGMTMAEAYTNPTQLVTFYLAFGVTAHILCYLVACCRKIVHFVLPRHRMINAHA